MSRPAIRPSVRAGLSDFAQTLYQTLDEPSPPQSGLVQMGPEAQVDSERTRDVSAGRTLETAALRR